ncbi:MAG: response regulator [Terriglobales bacterium]
MLSPVLLCVDDRPELLQVRKAKLERLGYSVATATNALTAMAILQNTAVAAVLLDYKLEGMDAEAVAFHIKQRFPNQPIVLLSAYSKTPERLLWLVDEYVMRSEPLERLTEVIERVRCPAKKAAPRTDTHREDAAAAAA